MSQALKFKKRLTIGVLDSGIGGLTVLRQLVRTSRLLNLTPRPHFIYLADTSRFPYGKLSATQIQEYSIQMIGWLAAKGCEVAVVACHTISASTSASAVAVFDKRLPICDMRGISDWLSIPNGEKIVVLSTPATASTAVIKNSIAAKYPKSEVNEIGCPELASIIEQGLDNCDQMHEILNSYAEQIIQAKADTVILGCTHYPFISEPLAQLLPDRIKIIDPAIQFADYFFGQLGFKSNQDAQAKNSLKQRLASSAGIEIAFHVSGNPTQFKSKLSNYTPELHGTVSPVTIDELESFSPSKLARTDLMSA